MGRGHGRNKGNLQTFCRSLAGLSPRRLRVSAIGECPVNQVDTEATGTLAVTMQSASACLCQKLRELQEFLQREPPPGSSAGDSGKGRTPATRVFTEYSAFSARK